MLVLGKDQHERVGRQPAPELAERHVRNPGAAHPQVRTAGFHPALDHQLVEAHLMVQLQRAGLDPECPGVGGAFAQLVGMIRTATPSLVNQSASTRPVGPAPTIKTGVLAISPPAGSRRMTNAMPTRDTARRQSTRRLARMAQHLPRLSTSLCVGGRHARANANPTQGFGATRQQLGDWETEDSYWRDNWTTQPYVSADRGYDFYRPAYRYGFESAQKHRGRPWAEAEHEIRTGWDRYEHRGQSTWEHIKDAVRDGWNRIAHRT